MQQAFATRPNELVIPDCCNIGVIFRALIAVNLAVFVALLLRTQSLRAGLQEFFEACMLIELACLFSLFMLCGLRQAIGTAAPGWQRLACSVVPSAVTGVIVHLMSGLDWLWNSFSHLDTSRGMLAAALLAAALQHYFELRMRAFSPALTEARLQALQARIRPHFLFNSLNAVLSLIRDEPRRAEATLEDLADLFRSLMSDPRNITTLDGEIRLCQQYLSVEKLRLGERLQVTWRIENLTAEAQRKARIPVLLLQPLLENAVHYGVEPASEPVPVLIEIGRSVDRLHIVVRNPVHPGARVDGGNHMALNNIRERLDLLYDVEAQFSAGQVDNMFEVQLRFPYVTQNL
ncbi:two-component system, LytT family, sensor histidine kinase AlgZ [Noviherbaspirillum humi]|uniref:Two-component system, LytT family, sensor histidine kinase AlgZ n=1 Tax=Noviherbaspirillum humi TaxID=1688639 RepID=A0A239GUS0_9BURK|nr:histidine kinase [Noviherbaspirillum humi]SNS72263.1 two-component system, LytT family, sensor histidine kinase AlgZ [Noviherbaspirillum humi]